MVSLQTAEKALKTIYLDVVADQLNNSVSPFFSKIEQTESDVYGKEIVKVVSHGFNGGIGAGTETGALPVAGGARYQQFRSELKNLYGTIEISDKAIRASQHDSGAFVNLLNAEMESLLDASKQNLARMLMGDGTGKLAPLKARTADLPKNAVALSAGINKFAEGMIVDIKDSDTNKVITGLASIIVEKIDRSTGVVYFADFVDASATNVKSYVSVQGSFGNEITGVDAIFDENIKTLYGLDKDKFSWLTPYSKTASTFSIDELGTAFDHIEAISGTQPDMILCSFDARRMYVKECQKNNTNVDIMTLDGGYNALSYNGIPVVCDRYLPDGTFLILNSDNFKLHRLCDWRWLEGEGGSVLKQKDNQACYSATLVKYAELICDHPGAQAKITIK